jgi:tRNA-specific 2-thiouridylase
MAENMNDNKRENDKLHRSADGVGYAGEAGCGARIWLAVNFSGDRIEKASATAEGAATAVAAASAIAENITGTDWREAARLGVADIIAPITKASGDGGKQECPPERVAAIAIEALHGALEDALRSERFPVAEVADPETVIVAMSGGVDSSTACVLEQRAGKNVIGVTLRLWSDPEVSSGGASCCSPSSIEDAREVCHQLGVPHLTFDCSDLFEREVVEYFTSEYRRGRTPNPCTYCNGSFRFPLLMRLAARLGAARVATGHYARVKSLEHSGTFLLVRGADRIKDQSYMLWGIDGDILEFIDFPVGGMIKTQTRAIAAEARLDVHERPESQEVCFIPDDDYRRFLRTRIADVPGEGDIVDLNGKVLGRHGSIIDYTVGQRRGLGISAPEPLYVIRTDPRRNLVVVGSRDDLEVTTIDIDGVNRYLSRSEIDDCMVQVRYNSDAVPGKVNWYVTASDEDQAQILLKQPVLGVAPGQSAVLYHGDTVVAGGVISATGNR